MNVRNSINTMLGVCLHLILRATARQEKNRLGGTVLVFTPHPDDETLACGGVISREVERGSDVIIACVTDGRHGGSTDPENLATLRKDELIRAMRSLGGAAIEVVMLDFEDSTLDLRGDELDVALSSLVALRQPTIVFSPSPLDPHPDHAALGAATRRVLAQLDVRHLEYFVWGWRYPVAFIQRAVRSPGYVPTRRPLAISIGHAAGAKAAALACYSSQLAVLQPDLLRYFSGAEELFFEVSRSPLSSPGRQRTHSP